MMPSRLLSRTSASLNEEELLHRLCWTPDYLSMLLIWLSCTSRSMHSRPCRYQDVSFQRVGNLASTTKDFVGKVGTYCQNPRAQHSVPRASDLLSPTCFAETANYPQPTT